MTDHDTNHVFKDADALVVYASTHGHTAKIAGRIAGAMRAEGLEVDLRAVADAQDVKPGRYDLAVVGASVHKGHHQKEIVEWVREHRDALAQMPSLLVSVSLSAAEDLAAARQCIDEFLAETGWTPTRSEPVAGCLQYREYDLFTRQLMRLLMKRGGHPTDATQDYDYTDWEAVDRLAREFAALRVTA
jgi:menaquinone-dependent protoporphyrinogen oxidase